MWLSGACSRRGTTLVWHTKSYGEQPRGTYSEKKLIEIAYSFEQATSARSVTTGLTKQASQATPKAFLRPGLRQHW